MSAINNGFLLGAGDAEYAISRSLRFRAPYDAYLARIPASVGNTKTWTWAGWVKRSTLGTTDQSLFTVPNDTASDFALYIRNNRIAVSTWSTLLKEALPVLRDTSAWYHIVCAVDTDQPTATLRIQLYINGVQPDSSNYASPALGQGLAVNTTGIHRIGLESFLTEAREAYDGYLADIYFIDGQALAPTSFGEFSAITGAWVPKAYLGTYGTNGFHLEFADNSAATATTLGKDTSGNGNNWTPNSLSVRQGIPFSSLVNGPGAGNIAGMFDQFTGSEGFFRPGTGGGLTFSGRASVTAASSLYIRSRSQFNNTGNWVINGVNTGIPCSNTLNETYNLSSLCPVTIQSIGTSSGNFADAIYVQFIQVDGQQLLATNETNDSLVDVPTNGNEVDTGLGGEVRGNYCTWDPLGSVGATLTNGNLEVTLAPDFSVNYGVGTIGVSTGKWYWEIVSTAIGEIPAIVGVANLSASNKTAASSNAWAYLSSANKITGNVVSAYGSAWTAEDVIGVALDMDAGLLTFYKNGVSQGVAFDGLSGRTLAPQVGTSGSLSKSYTANFGQRPFAHPAPSGFKTLCTTNLPAPTIKLTRNEMNIVGWTGDGAIGSRTISSLNFTPGLVWTKSISLAANNLLYDVLRGPSSLSQSWALTTNGTSSEGGLDDNGVNGYLAGFLANGFVFAAGSTPKYFNAASQTYIAWCWNAGNSNVDNTAGTIASVLRANVSAGFSIVSFLNSTGDKTFGHGLGVAPRLVIMKNRSSPGRWLVYHSSLAANSVVYLNETTAATNDNAFSQGSGQVPSSAVVPIRCEDLGGTGTFIAYCFAPVAGYSVFGSYTGNGNVDGPMVFMGIRPRWIMIKRTDAAGNWIILDGARLGYNVENHQLFPNLSNIQGTTELLDILSNGIKLRSANASVNASAGTYIYAAFAGSSFKYARAR